MNVTKQKHILFLVSSMEEGGAERVASLLCNYWVEKGHKVTLMPTYSGRGDCVYEINDKVNISFLSDILGSTKNNFWSRVRRFILLRKVILNEAPDVIVSFLAQVNVTAILAAIGTYIPVIVSERTYPPQYPIGFIWTILRRITYPLASAIVMQTNQGLDWLKDECPHGRGFVISNPIIFPMSVGKPIVETTRIVEDKKNICLAVGRLDEGKRFIEIINVFSGLAREFTNWDLVFLGDGEERAALEKEAIVSGLQERIHLPGRVGNLGDWYERANLFVLNSRFEGFPNVLLEAMAHGVPCVSVDCDTGPRDLISSEENGLLIPNNSSKHLRSSMEILMRDITLARALGQSAKEVREKFSINTIGAEWDALIASCLMNRRV